MPNPGDRQQSHPPRCSSLSPLIQRHTRAHNPNPNTTNPPPERHGPNRRAPVRTRHDQRPQAQHQRADEGRVPAPEPVGQRVRQQDIRQERAEVVDARHDALLRRRGVAERRLPARVHEHRREHADVVAPDGGADGEVQAQRVQPPGACWEGWTGLHLTRCADVRSDAAYVGQV
ncbi:Hypothetical protein TPAR_09310 [Tolypocladium paradoxum]|uniref:Uncharacterized protein n=1 Tax=Tolypocladium paradoxum TaxID=94208 RepID=A0A2S4KX69_9HYPO|nr:Hypothetical protein TPAR_09310 [Tolypocladium paradoxum]